MRYTIEEETLTALGDAVRGKTITKGQRYFIADSVEISYEYTKKPHIINTDFISGQKIKVKLTITYLPRNNRIYGMPVGIASGAWSYSSQVTNQPDYEHFGGTATINNATEEDIVVMSFEKILDGPSFSIVPGQGNGFTPAQVDIEYWILDKDGKDSYTSLDMVDVISGFNTLSDGALVITGDCGYRFANNGWNTFIKELGDKITTQNISNTGSMFYYSSNLKEIPFDINTVSILSANEMFSTSGIIKAPYVIDANRETRPAPTGSYSGTLTLNKVFYCCYYLREIHNDWFWKIVENKEFWEGHKKYPKDRGNLFYSCYSLRELPDISMLSCDWTSNYGSIYYMTCYQCASLNKITNFPVCGTFTSNALSDTFKYCYRINDLTFETNEDGTPKTANWKSQTLDLSTQVGYADSTSAIVNYNSGITNAKLVNNDTTYQALKDDPDWYTDRPLYSRYNHDSAVNTINSLPDTSAYGTNTIKFKGQCGTNTDGGAINTLTEEEIAVAAAKGWTVSLV